jgi:hypothetical protein
MREHSIKAAAESNKGHRSYLPLVHRHLHEQIFLLLKPRDDDGDLLTLLFPSRFSKKKRKIQFNFQEKNLSFFVSPLHERRAKVTEIWLRTEEMRF